MWGDYQVFLIATLVLTRLLLDDIYHLIELPFEWFIDDAVFVSLLDELILGFCYSNLTLETGGFELASTMTLVLQANRLTKCASKIVNFFKTIDVHIAIIYQKLTRMDEEQAVLKQLKISNFNMWSSLTLKTFNIFSKVMINSSNNMTMSWAWCYFFCY